MPSADASQFIAMKRFANQTNAPNKGKDRYYQAPIRSSGVGLGLRGFLPSLRKPVVDFYINGTLVFTYGVVGSGGDYSSIIQALAAQYDVDPSAITIRIEEGSIIVNFTIYYGTPPPSVPTNASFINTITSAILNNSSTNLTFTGPANAATLTITTSGSTTQLTAPNLFNKFDTSGVTLPESPAFSSAFDHIGNYFLVYLHKIYKITPNGVVSLFAGGDEPGFNNGNGTEARFSFGGDLDSEMAFDSENNMYISDGGNDRIRKITPNGYVSTLAGSGEAYADVDGIGEAAVTLSPIGLTIDSNNLLVSTTGTNIRKINIITREVTTLNFGTPPVYKYVSLRFDSNTKNLYALDFRGRSDGNVVHRISNNIGFNNPIGMVFDSAGNLYVADSGNNKIQKINTSGEVSTFAGSDQGFANGQGTNAKFNEPRGITIDSDGNLYVADTGNFTIRKITPGGYVSTFAGSISGFANGPRLEAQFRAPVAIAIDSAGNFYICDSQNCLIQKIDTSGQVTTFAGSTQGFEDGSSDVAKFYSPIGITIDSDDNLYVADFNNHRIRKITPNGDVSTLAGSDPGWRDGTLAQALFDSPFGITIDSSGNLYVADFNNHRIRKINIDGVTTIAGSEQGYVDGPGIDAKFNHPSGITIDSGNLYVADAYNNKIRIIDSSANVTTLVSSSYSSEVFVGNPNLPASASSEVNGYRTSAQFQGIDRIELDSRGNLYLSETPYRRIRFIDPAGYVSTLIKDDFNVTSVTSPGLIVPSILGISKTTPTLIRYQIPTGEIYDFSPENSGSSIGGPGGGPVGGPVVTAIVTTIAGSSRNLQNGRVTEAKFNRPHGIVYIYGYLCIADTGNHILRRIDPSGNVITYAGSTAGFLEGRNDEAKFDGPIGVVFDSRFNVYVADNNNLRVRRIENIFAGGVSTYVGSGLAGLVNSSGSQSRFLDLFGITADSDDNFYVTDARNNVIRKIDNTTDRNVTTFAGSGAPGFANGQGTAAQFFRPGGITIDLSGNLYVADTLNNRIRKITPGKQVTTIAGSGAYGFVDGQGTAAQFNKPFGITIDSAGILYVADTNNHAIRKIDTSGLVTTIAGDGIIGSEGGQGSTARFNYPSGITTDSNDNLYVADTENDRIRKITFI